MNRFLSPQDNNQTLMETSTSSASATENDFGDGDIVESRPPDESSDNENEVQAKQVKF